ncbi:flagellar M-ring protein FliF [Thermodesulfatator indicus DSM 15286]|uniref:Flagellar M-ring protein n=1 Tax=Thermodesulfatator indicus (strain DSM 15286 / JCM 11887 / CIR29812) TaxID=667014 RepID=F8ABX5_THEID|nr:flagellar basal-body MS-ring/collar protein FliF [Thermodesulfatator indicus]AEH45667.1 flagellar M-ring protein FliF [Thermodesulfatator indicus DSM 15286]
MAFPPPKEVLKQLKDFWQGLSREQRIAAIGTVLIVTLGLLGLIYYANRTDWGLLYKGLPEERAAQVIDFLKQEKIPYKVESNGAIKVPRDKVPEVRMALASHGILSPDVTGFEIFDKNQLGATDFLQRVNYQRALEGELARTIMSLSEVEAARVHLALPKESVFIEDQKPPKASVFLKLKNGQRLSRREVEGIVNLVASAVPGLTPEHITVVDTKGRVLYRPESPEERLNAEQLAYRKQLEEAYQEKIESLLTQALGPGHAIAQVSVDVDFTKEVRKEETYDPEGIAVRSELIQDSQKEGGTEGGVPGVKGALANKIEGNTKGFTQTQRETKKSITKNYEVSKVVREQEFSPGAIKKISVAVLLDEAILNKGAKKGEAQAATNLAEERLAQVEKLVKGAIGYDPDRGDQVEVSVLPFEGLEEMKPESPWVAYADRFARPLIEFLLVLLFLLLVIRPVLKTFLKRLEPEPEPLPEEALPEAEEEALPEEEPTPLPQEIALNIIHNQPERAAVLVKRWLAEETEEERQKALKEAEANAH